MKEIKSFSANPVGQQLKVYAVNNFIDTVLENVKEKIGTCPWWKFWGVVDWQKAVGFFIVSMDGLIVKLANEAIPGAAKKATVLAALDKAYDVIIVGAAPIWLKPFVIPAKSFILNTVCSMLIDWFVEKYKDGSWRMMNEETKQEVPTT